MKLVLEDTDVLLPEWLGEKFPSDYKEGYLWTTFTPGFTLEAGWEKLKNDAKQRLCEDIWDMIARIRKIQRPSEYQQFFQCTADKSPTHDPLIKDLKKPPTPLFDDSALRERIYEH